MNYRTLILLPALLLTLIVSADEKCPRNSNLKDLKTVCESEVSEDSQLIAKQLEKSGFDCGSPSIVRGFRCRGKLDSYSQPINFFIPAHYTTKKKTNWLWHFHGHTTDPQYSQFNIKSGTGDFGKFITQAGSNDILIVPESRGKCDDFREIQAKQFAKMLQQGRTLLQKSGASIDEKSTLGLSGHSGAYEIFNRIGIWSTNDSTVQVELKQLTRIALLDSVYTSQDAGRFGISTLIEYTRKAPGHQILLAYNPTGPNGAGNRFLETQAKMDSSSNQDQLTIEDRNGKIISIRDAKTSHMNFVPKYLQQIL